MDKVLRDRRLYEFLEKVDKDFAAQLKSSGCEHCGAVLHRADYERKPRGAQVGPSWDKRCSFCCSRDGCRKRHTPASVRFLGRKVYAGVIVVLVSAMMHGPNEHKLKRLQQELAIDRRTLKRWRLWWTQIFVQCAFWTAQRELMRDVPRISGSLKIIILKLQVLFFDGLPAPYRVFAIR